MRVAIYAGMFKKDQDGATKTLYRLVNSLLTAGSDVGVWGFSITPQERAGLQLFTMPSIPWPLYRDYRVTVPVPRVLRTLHRFQPDLIQITVPDLVGAAFVSYAKRHRIPVVATYHSVFPEYLKYFKIGFLTAAAWRTAARFYQRVDMVYVPTEIAADELRKRGVQQIKIWSRGIDLGQFGPSYSRPWLRDLIAAGRKSVILYSGRLVSYKDVDVLADVYDLFHRGSACSVRFIVAGSGPKEKSLRKRMPEALFTGYLHGDDLARIYANSDLLLFPSTTESFGNVVMEALASGIPAVVSDHGGCQEIISRSGAGLIARSGDAADFHRQCVRLIDTPDLYRRMRGCGLEFVKHRSWEKITATLVAEFISIIQDSFETVPLATIKASSERESARDSSRSDVSN